MSLELKDSLILVKSGEDGDTSFGTGFIIYKAQECTYILTCAHVMKKVTNNFVVMDEFEAEIVAIGKEDSIDIAVLKVQRILEKPILTLGGSIVKNIAYTTCGFSRSAKGLECNPREVKLRGNEKFQPTIPYRANHFPAWNIVIEKGAPLAPGCSGSPVIDKSNKVVGIITEQFNDTGQEGRVLSIEVLASVWSDMPSELRDQISRAELPSSQSWLQRIQQQFTVDRSLLFTLGISTLIGIIVIALRFFGVLQTLELSAYDWFLQMRPDEQPDNRIVVLEIDHDYLDKLDRNFETTTGGDVISDRTLTKILQKLEKYQPKTIGLDLYRSHTISLSDISQKESLLKFYRTDRSPLFAVCLAPFKDKDKSISPPPEMQDNQRIGFSNAIPDDQTNMARRHLVFASSNGRSGSCTTELSFSLQIAAHYLEQTIEATPNGILKLGSVIFNRLPEDHAGGYNDKDFDSDGYQILLNYRAPQNDPLKIANKIRIQDFLDPGFDRDIIGKIVLIGVNDPERRRDIWRTPYSDKDFPGVFLQAQMVSQIISAVQNKRAFLGIWNPWLDTLWIMAWSLVCGLILGILSFKGLTIGKFIVMIFGVAACLLVSVFFVCRCLFQDYTVWVPFVPPFSTIIFITLAAVISRTLQLLRQSLSG
jgi:CHASE2 domain-containing sensor protein